MSSLYLSLFPRQQFYGVLPPLAASADLKGPRKQRVHFATFGHTSTCDYGTILFFKELISSLPLLLVRVSNVECERLLFPPPLVRQHVLNWEGKRNVCA